MINITFEVLLKIIGTFGTVILTILAIITYRKNRRSNENKVSLPHLSNNTIKYEEIIGRVDAIETIQDLYDKYKKEKSAFFLIVKGVGGIGKTHLTKHFAIKQINKSGIDFFYVDGMGKSIVESLKLLAGNDNIKVKYNQEIDKQIPKIIQQIPSDSILLLDNIGDFKGYQSLFRLKKVFVIITTQFIGQSLLRKKVGHNKCIEFILEEFSFSECQKFFTSRVPKELSEILQKNIERVLQKSEQRSPFYLEIISNVAESLFKERKFSSSRLFINHLIKELNKGRGNDNLSKVITYAIDKVLDKDFSEKLLLSCAIFSPYRIPINQLLETTKLGENENQEALEYAISWGILNKGGENNHYLIIHNRFYIHLQEVLEQKTLNVKNKLKKRFVEIWLRFLMKNEDLRILVREQANIRKTLQIFWQLDFSIRSELKFNINNLTIKHLILLPKILPPKERIEFLSKFLIAEINEGKIAEINSGLSDSFLRIKKFNQAMIFARAALSSFDNLNNSESKAWVLRRIGTIYRSTGDLAASIASYQEAFTIYANFEDEISMADVSRQLAKTYLELGQTSNASKKLSNAVRVLEKAYLKSNNSEIGNSLAYALTTSGNTLLKIGNFKLAKNNIEKALKIHKKEVGDSHYYIGYDLRYLGKAETKLKNFDKGIECLQKSLRINEDFFGDSSTNVAIILLLLAECSLENNDLKSALIHTERALKIYQEEIGKNNKYIAYVYRVLADILINKLDIEQAENYLFKAEDILKTKYLKTPLMTPIKHLQGKINILKGKVDKGISILWAVRADYIRFGMVKDKENVDKDLTVAYLTRGVDDWGISAEEYNEYLNKFQKSTHNILGQELINKVLVDVKTNEIKTPTILDIFCGTGFINKEISKRRGLNYRTIGIDGSKAMIRIAKKWLEKRSNKKNNFFHIPSQWELLKECKFKYITLHMAVFQMDVRARHFLFRQIIPLLEDEATILFSTYSADFSFPKEFEEIYPDINKSSLFKERLLKAIKQLGYICALDLEKCLTPIFVKENLKTISYFLELYGFELVPIRKGDIIPIKRKWKDRVKFTQIPVIQKKVFGKLIDKEVWDKVYNRTGESDTTFGLVLKAKRKRFFTKVPSIFCHAKLDFSKNYPIRYAVAAILKNNKGETLFLKRGEGARDNQGAWSLPSTFADNGTLLESLIRSMERRVNLERKNLSQLTPVSIRFGLRKNWIIAMCVFSGRLSQEPDLRHDKTKKYEEFTWENEDSFLNGLSPKEMGDCIKSYRDLVKNPKI